MRRDYWQAAGKVLTILIVASLVAIIGAGAWIVRRGVSTRTQPTGLESIVARAARHLAMPSAMRNVRNPLPASASVLADGRAHWADHCATCHANDGSGNTEIGVNLYPKPPDMRRSETQDLTDGELFSIIKNGIRLTGMPAWGDAEGHDDADNWKLVHFIRHLPKITPDELDEMEKLNPKSPDEWREMENENSFLKGDHH